MTQHKSSLSPYWARSFADPNHKQTSSMADPKHGMQYSRSIPVFPPTNVAHFGAGFASVGKAGQGYGMLPNSDVTSIAHSFQGMNIQNPTFATQSKNTTMSTTANAYGPLSSEATIPYNPTASYLYANAYNTNANQPAGMYTPHTQHYMSPMNYASYQQHDNSPISHHWTPGTNCTPGDIPTLITPRRGSISPNENDQPTTPAGAYGYGYPQAGVAVRRSPSGPFSHNTPSPVSLSMGTPYGLSTMKHQEQSDISPDLKMLIMQEPVIPPAIPAPSSPLKPLDRALENQRGETNVYIRGLLPETTDEMLQVWGSRFGDIKSSKSIIDMQTGLCKGFGFVKYHNYEDAENCIRGFHHLGYEVSFARESFYSKLKTFSDESNTNLYVSNLSKTMNEHELAQLFHPHKVCSSRILRDKNGNGRGVGFARFESREACEEVIQTFNNTTIKHNGKDLQMQIRYADTQEQKSLKQHTQAARQFRSAEYEYATQAWRRAPQYVSPTSRDNQQHGNEFDQYLQASSGGMPQGQRWVSPTLRRSPLGASIAQTPTSGLHSNLSQESPTAQGKDNLEAKSAVTASMPGQGSPVDSINPVMKLE